MQNNNHHHLVGYANLPPIAFINLQAYMRLSIALIDAVAQPFFLCLYMYVLNVEKLHAALCGAVPSLWADARAQESLMSAYRCRSYNTPRADGKHKFNYLTPSAGVQLIFIWVDTRFYAIRHFSHHRTSDFIKKKKKQHRSA